MNRETNIQELLLGLYARWSDNAATAIEPMPVSGSYRKYFRIRSKKETIIGVYNPDERENVAFIEFTRHFGKKGLPVPKIYAEDRHEHIYLLEDLGDETLFSLLTKERAASEFPDHLMQVYKKVIDFLPQFQINAGSDLDYAKCYPRPVFDKQSMLWDMNYFKYYFLKLLKISFNEQELEDDFEKFTGYLHAVPHDYFLYRDFQSRNIMIVEDEPYFIDYQGGRKGPLHYDIASLLWDAKADIPMHQREELFGYYTKQISRFIKTDNEQFREQYYAFVYIRIMQALGAYGFRGFYERKEHFLLSIPYAVKNLEWLLDHAPLPVDLPALRSSLEQIVANESLRIPPAAAHQLTVSLYSFSYKNGIPQDLSGHGGGFVFDCRALPNPGRIKDLAEFNGRDKIIIDYLEQQPATGEFFSHVQKLVSQAVENYLERGFSRLMISFGCTGGQHRSVYFAEKLRTYLQDNYSTYVKLIHRELKD
jgi:aminoglycoside/choline kinase family phosphotransferase